MHDLRAIAAALGGEGGSCIAGARALLRGWAWANTLTGSVQGALCAACCEGKRRNYDKGPGLGLLCDFRTHAVYRPGCDGCSAHRPCRPAAVVEPACDVGSVHRFLRHQGLPGVHKVRPCTRVKLRREPVLPCFCSRRLPTLGTARLQPASVLACPSAAVGHLGTPPHPLAHGRARGGARAHTHTHTHTQHQHHHHHHHPGRRQTPA